MELRGEEDGACDVFGNIKRNVVPEKYVFFGDFFFSLIANELKPKQHNPPSLSLSQVGEKITQRRTMFVIGHYGIVARR